MKRKRTLVILAVAGLAGFIAVEAWLHWRVVPGGHASTLREYLAWQPGASQFRAVDRSGNGHLIAYGKTSGIVPSGPSAYVFDAQGKMVDWSADVGDDPLFNQKWKSQEPQSGQTVSRQAVESMAAAQAGG